jgi:cytochrome bd-type quinol oxidase subunit 2
MDVVWLSRVQFAVTIMFHYIFPPLAIGLAVVMVWLVTSGGALFGAALYPNLVTAANDPARSLTVLNAASSPRTLTIMLVIAAVGMPFVATYTGVIYWTFRGKVKLDSHSY